MTFWDRLKNQIRKENTTQEWVAGQIDVSYRTFRGWVSRKIMPNADQAVAIAKALNTTVEYLVSGITEPGKSLVRIEFDRMIDQLSDRDIDRVRGIVELAFPELSESVKTKNEKERLA